ncbi:MAG: anthranilate phosphoribosyltransferase [Cytophagales bacterium]|nr:anthranilate phosphoribosyltransferase [Armatimonadota bacterium]
MQTALRRLTEGGSLSRDEAAQAMTTIMEGTATPAQIGALLAALRVKGETTEEITGFARVMRERSLRVHTRRQPLLDTCGTGGDTVKTFNISTASAFVAAAAGIAVAKHGNRSVTSKCGSADVLESLGVRLDLLPEAVGQCIDAVGIGFLFARNHHPAMRHAAGPRAELGVRTVFNALGPLTNPASAKRQVIGVYDASLCVPLAEVLGNLGSEHVLVVHGRAGLDEIATFGETVVAEYDRGRLSTYTLTPQDLGLAEASPLEVAPGNDVTENAAILRAVLSGEDRGPRREIVLANAAAAFYVAGIVSSLVEGVAKAATTIDTGAAAEKIEDLVRYTRQGFSTEGPIQ